jgi:hypothetical protein
MFSLSIRHSHPGFEKLHPRQLQKKSEKPQKKKNFEQAFYTEGVFFCMQKTGFTLLISD